MVTSKVSEDGTTWVPIMTTTATDTEDGALALADEDSPSQNSWI